MKSTTLIVTMLVALTLLVSACAPAATPVAPTAIPPTAVPTAVLPTTVPTTASPTQAAAATATMAPPATPSGPATVNLGSSSKYGSFLVDSKGITLYLYTKDTPGTSVCYGKCATLWPPLLTNGAPVAGTGVDSSKFGTTTRTDGTTQVTYKGWPLYYYYTDLKSGDTTGQAVGTVWYLISPTGDEIKTP
jgi:predicted lipoprotein with Yx(FWY)xxD motif